MLIFYGLASAATRMVTLSRRLRIGPLGRQPNRSVRPNTRPATQFNYYDRAALEDDWNPP